MGYSNCGPSACGPGGFVVRRYWSKSERKAWLEDYASQLENELTAVKERIEKLSE